MDIGGAAAAASYSTAVAVTQNDQVRAEGDQVVQLLETAAEAADSANQDAGRGGNVDTHA